MWTQGHNQILKSLVLQKHQLNWNILATNFGVTPEQIKAKWAENVYPTIRSNRKIAGAYIWTQQENEIVRNINKDRQNIWQLLVEFLPDRTHFSVQARWKRIHAIEIDAQYKNTEVGPSQLIKQNHKKRLLEYKRILQLRQKIDQNPQMSCQTGQQGLGMQIQ